MASLADFKNGLCLEFHNDIYTITEFQHVKPGKGPAFVRTKLKSLRSGKVLDKTFNAGEKITTARVEKRGHQFLYSDEMGYHFMDTENFEQIRIDEKLIERSNLLKEGQLVDIMVHEETETPLAVELPPFVELMITYTEPGIKGDTATNAQKSATLETGATVMVPLFVEQDIMIKVDTRDGSYSERVK
ncbi:elongation factor P [Rhodonellum psychrophilum GCM71 = DSM 17998]|uniref:Elongation factor P n=2 Tax=Rhodonellum TaxID=336827 RepID=U5C8P5_9BACT|nr:MULTISPECIES: elongation factor P [Rhodonellum]ERM84582.1 elongation factor P [Rhodonellum psychrophilum GCM71 = DSM 17998]MDO9554850.1 elongation factor P [Rhodonellum sp.]SDY85773.1 translation elongation factor P (EF-P) [Rhodonellum ikkaensis]